MTPKNDKFDGWFQAVRIKKETQTRLRIFHAQRKLEAAQKGDPEPTWGNTIDEILQLGLNAYSDRNK